MKYLEQDHPRMDHTRASRQIGRAAALALFFITVAYVIITIADLVSLKSPQEPIQDPYFFLIEMLIVVTAPLYVVVMVAVHASAARAVKAYSLTALVFMIVCVGITSAIRSSIAYTLFVLQKNLLSSCLGSCQLDSAEGSVLRL